MLDQLGKEETKNILSSYLCPINKDIEYFLHERAIEFSKQGIAATHLIFTSYKNTPVLIGYFTLANKQIYISNSRLSNNFRKRVKKFGISIEKGYIIVAPLLAQFGKNYKNNYDKLISGDELIKIVIDKVKYIHTELGGKFLYLECEDTKGLLDFYESHGYINIGKREVDRDEKDRLKGAYLVQMLKYINL